jgi:hypothetical protein
MTESGLLEHIFERLSRADSGEEIFARMRSLVFFLT